MKRGRRCVMVLLWLLPGGLFAQGDWQTDYEKANYLRTPRYAETIAYCQRLDSASAWIKYTAFGTSPQGRELPLVIVDKKGNFTPEAVRRSGNVIVLIQSGIHAGEMDGKDASLMLLREMAITRKLAHLLDGVTVLFVPIFNVDGHEMMSKFNRINQNGPLEMGFRATAQRLNLNRDFLKAEAPEMQAWLRIFHAWLPDFLVDNHVTDGADHQYGLTYGIDTHRNVAAPLRQWLQEVMEPYLNRQMEGDQLPVMPYFSMKERPDIQNGILINEYYSPRYSTGYGGIQNRAFLLVETHALKDYQTRVTANYHLLIHLLTLLGRERERLQMVNRRADAQTAEQLPGTYLPLDFAQDLQDTLWLDFRGKEYRILPSEISGGPWVKYGRDPVRLSVPAFSRTVATDSAMIPYAYIIPPEWQFHIEKLQSHGVTVQRFTAPQTVPVESYRLTNPQWRRQPFEGHFLLKVEREIIREERLFPVGSAVVVMNQRTNRLAAALLEPHAPDSFVRWGFWNTLFERKEYAEDSVMEDKARLMLKDNPALQAEFEQALAADSALAGNRRARLYFFYARTPYYEKLGVYPVGKVMSREVLSRLQMN